MDYEKARKDLVAGLESRGIIASKRVRDAALKVPREAFVPSHERRYAYEDTPLPIGEGQTISAPHGLSRSPGGTWYS